MAERKTILAAPAAPIGGHEVAEHRRAQRRGRAPFAAAFVALLSFATVMVLVNLGDTRALDHAVTLDFQRLHSGVLLDLLIGVSWFGFEPQAAILGLGVVAILFWRRLRLESGFALLGLAVAVLNVALKGVSRRARPVGEIGGIIVHGSLGGYSFPSGHVLTYVVFGGFLAYLTHTLMRERLLRRAVLAFLLALIVLVGPSRVYLGQHWFTDVLASYLLGAAALLGLLALYRRAKVRQLASGPVGEWASGPVGSRQ